MPGRTGGRADQIDRRVRPHRCQRRHQERADYESDDNYRGMTWSGIPPVWRQDRMTPCQSLPEPPTEARYGIDPSRHHVTLQVRPLNGRRRTAPVSWDCCGARSRPPRGFTHDRNGSRPRLNSSAAVIRPESKPLRLLGSALSSATRDRAAIGTTGGHFGWPGVTLETFTPRMVSTSPPEVRERGQQLLLGNATAMSRGRLYLKPVEEYCRWWTRDSTRPEGG